MKARVLAAAAVTQLDAAVGSATGSAVTGVLRLDGGYESAANTVSLGCCMSSAVEQLYCILYRIVQDVVWLSTSRKKSCVVSTFFWILCRCC